MSTTPEMQHRQHGLGHAASTPTIELGELLHEYSLGLVLIAGVSEAAAARPVQWVHVSELEDPTPFLPARTVLLTTGARFTALPTQHDADDYVSRLLLAGTTALGIAVGLHWDRVPARFVSACDRLGLPLFRVPYDTAFIAVVQAAARLLDARARERDVWSLEAQRAVTAASLHRNGLGAAVREAAHRLGRWVCIADRSGRIIEFAPESAHEVVHADWLRREIRRLVDRGVGATRVGPGPQSPGADELHEGVQVQTLGRTGQVLGVLVAEDGPQQDTAERTLLGLISALATVQLEHRSGINAAQASLRSAIVHLLSTGQSELAERIAADAIVRIPHDPIVAVAFAAATLTHHRFVAELQSLDAGSAGFILAEIAGAPLIVSEIRHLPAIRRLFRTHGVPAGVSAVGSSTDLADRITQAARALSYAEGHALAAAVDYSAAEHDGLLQLIAQHDDTLSRARALLDPVRQHDARHGDDIEACLFLWLTHHGHTSPAATALGVHRHTLKAKIQTAATLLQLDLDSPDVRAELWTALRLTR